MNTLYKLYPPGTLGRVFIDLSLNVVKAISPGSIELINDSLRINNPELLLNALNTVRANFLIKNYDPFPMVGNDKASLTKKIPGFNPADSSTILTYAIEVIEKGGLNRLADTVTSPSLMRIELYEYTKRGFVTYRSFKDYPQKQASVLDLALAVLGSYISTTTRGDNEYYYLIPSTTYIDLEMLQNMKNMIGRIVNVSLRAKDSTARGSLEILLTYRLARILKQTTSIMHDDVVGDLFVVEKGKNRLSLRSSYKLGTAGWIKLFNKLDDQSLKDIDTIVEVIEEYVGKYKSVPYIYRAFDLLFKYVQCVDDAIYQAVRDLSVVWENIKHVEEKQGASGESEWARLYNMLKDRGLKTPSIFIKVLNGKLARVGTESVCEETVLSQ